MMGDELVQTGPYSSMEGREMASIDFESLIGGPMIATIKAQIQASMMTVNFIKAVGFEQSPMADFSPTLQKSGKPAYVNFEYSKVLPSGNVTQAMLAVPFLTMLPIPTLRVEYMMLEVLARIDSTQAKSVNTTAGLGGEAAAKVGPNVGKFGVTAGLKVSAVLQRQTKEGNVVTRNYSMNIRLKASQDELPSGLDRVLTQLEANIREINKSGKLYDVNRNEYDKQYNTEGGVDYNEDGTSDSDTK